MAEAAVTFEHVRIAGELDPDIGKNGHQQCAECLELLPRVPNLADAEALFRRGPKKTGTRGRQEATLRLP